MAASSAIAAPKKKRRRRPKPPKIDVLTVAAMIAGISGTGMISAFGDWVDVLAPGWGKKAVAVISILSFGCGLIVRTTSANRRTETAATSGPAPAPVTPPATGSLANIVPGRPATA
jgi:hypothetical protein